MKILFLSHRFYPDLGGIETISEILATSFSNAGHQVHLLTWSEDQSSKSFPFKVIRNPNSRQLFKEHFWADLVFENNICLRLSWPSLLIGCPGVIGLQTWLSPDQSKSSLNDKIKLAWLKRAKKVIACSEAIRQNIWPQAIVIGNPYNEQTFRLIPNLHRSDNFIFLGRLVSDKGADIAVQALHRLITSMPIQNFSAKPSLTIVGDGPEKSKLELLVSDLQLQSHVYFAGPLHGVQIAECLNKHKLLIVPSRWKEPFGIVALEGIACGCIPVVSDNGGLPDAVGRAGITFKNGDVDDLVKSIQKVLNNVELADQMYHEAPEHLIKHSSAHVSKNYLSILESVFSKN